MKIIKSILCSVLVLCLAAFAAAPVFALEPASDTIYQGIDVSIFQGDIDFTAVKAAGKQVVYIRAGEGFDYTDPNYQTNFENATAAGMDAGFYYFVTAVTTAGAQQQAERFVSLISGYDYTIRPAMDYESFGGLDNAAINAVGLAFLEKLEELTDITPVVYTDTFRAQTLWSSDFGDYPLWIAEYNGNEQPADNDVWSVWSAYQFSDVGTVDGIGGNVDLDQYTTFVFTSTDVTPDPDPDPDPDTITYTVKTGDTLWAIANRYNTTVEAIVELNDIANPDLFLRAKHCLYRYRTQLPIP